MIFALKDNKLVYATRNLVDSKGLVCPGCSEEVCFRNGEIKIPHFAHVNKNCDITAEAESFEHIKGKLALYKFFKNSAKAQLEVYVPEIKQRADLMLTLADNTRLAIEYQCSIISEAKIMQRTANYKAVNIDVIWIAGPKYQQQRINKAMLSRFGQSFLAFLKKDRQGIILKYGFSQIPFEKMNFKGLNFDSAQKFLNFIKRTKQEKQQVSSCQKLSTNTLKKQALKIQENLVKNNYTWLDVQAKCYKQGLNVGGVPWIAHPQYVEPVCLKENVIIWRTKVLLELRKFNEGNTFKRHELYQIFYRQGIWNVQAEKQIKRYIYSFMRELINAGYLEIDHGTILKVKVQPRWFKDVNSKIEN